MIRIELLQESRSSRQTETELRTELSSYECPFQRTQFKWKKVTEEISLSQGSLNDIRKWVYQMERPNGNSLLWIFYYQLYWKQRMYCLVIKLHLIVQTVCWGFELQFEIICPIKKKKLTRVERTRPSSKPSNPGPKSVSRGLTYLIT